MEEVNILEDYVLEPYGGLDVVRSMSDVLLRTGTSLEELKMSTLEDVTEDIVSLPEKASLQRLPDGSYLDPSLANLLLPSLSIASRKALRATCRAWHAAINRIAPLSFPASYRFPHEIIQQIYVYLGPKDFNAARHTCRNWMRASLDRNLLSVMLQRGGWSSSAEAALQKWDHAKRNKPQLALMNEKWLLSRRLSKECALSSGWTNNGLDSARGHEAVVEVSDIDFTDLANGHAGSNGRKIGGLVFTSSICGQFLLVARDTFIYVYKIRGTTLVPATSIFCPRRVLSMSMDVSSGRNAVAALLEGRMGIVCELHYNHTARTDDRVETHVEAQGHPYRSIASSSRLASQGSDFEAGVEASQHHGEQDRAPFDSVNVRSNYEAVSLNEVNDDRRYVQNHVNQTWNLQLRGAPSPRALDEESSHKKTCSHTIPIENGKSTIYRHLCSEDDPPRSVSICPQRRCVAFGCSAGIELHWIDALSGQSLSRWFPLTAPSDYLYFLAPRPGFESAKKLRLISSAAHPDDRPAISRKFFLGRPTVSSFWGSFGFESNSRRDRSPNCDHYHAIPLSDGHHVLFIDPQTSKLFMGCDAPLGAPTKLLRKVMFIPPPSAQHSPPRLYTAAFDMTNGARIVVVFDDTIVLYSVPPDICNLSRAEQKAESWDVYNAPLFTTCGRTPDHCLNWWDEPLPSNRWGDNPIWPIPIAGTEIGVMRSVCEVTVSTTPDVTIWAFSLDAQARAWQVRGFADQLVRQRRFVCGGGLVHDAYAVDEGRDVIMTDIASFPPSLSPSPPSPSPPNEIARRVVGFDGTASQSWATKSQHLHTPVSEESSNSSTLAKRLPAALSVENDEWVDFLDFRGCDAWYELGGDVVVVPLGDGGEGWGRAWEIEVAGEKDRESDRGRDRGKDVREGEAWMHMLVSLWCE